MEKKFWPNFVHVPRPVPRRAAFINFIDLYNLYNLYKIGGFVVVHIDFIPFPLPCFLSLRGGLS